jgi:hypothetical protein
VWRKLKQLGAISLQDAAWVLPWTAKTQEHFQWLATEITELGGAARVWVATLVLDLTGESLQNQFLAQVDMEYKAIQAELRRKGRDLPALARRFQQTQTHDYFGSKIGATVRQQLLAARKERSK